jgi:hypothetical protein
MKQTHQRLDAGPFGGAASSERVVLGDLLRWDRRLGVPLRARLITAWHDRSVSQPQQQKTKESNCSSK